VRVVDLFPLFARTPLDQREISVRHAMGVSRTAEAMKKKSDMASEVARDADARIDGRRAILGWTAGDFRATGPSAIGGRWTHVFRANDEPACGPRGRIPRPALLHGEREESDYRKSQMTPT